MKTNKIISICMVVFMLTLALPIHSLAKTEKEVVSTNIEMNIEDKGHKLASGEKKSDLEKETKEGSIVNIVKANLIK